MDSYLQTALQLFLVLDAFGSMPLCHAILQHVPAERRRYVLMRELLIALVVLLFFLLSGNWLLGFLGVERATINLSGAFILFIIALGMVFPSKSVLHAETGGSEPFIVPIAVPLIAGPSSIALCLIMAKNPDHNLAHMSGVIFLAWLPSALILLLTPKLIKIIGPKGAAAMERLMGLLLMLIAVQQFLNGFVEWSSKLR